MLTTDELNRWEYSPAGGRLKLSGIYKQDRQELIAEHLRVGSVLSLVLKPNKFDPTGIAVSYKKKWLGWVKKEDSEWLTKKVLGLSDGEACHLEVTKLEEWYPDWEDLPDVAIAVSFAFVITRARHSKLNGFILRFLATLLSIASGSVSRVCLGTQAVLRGSRRVAQVAFHGTAASSKVAVHSTSGTAKMIDGKIAGIAGDDRFFQWILRFIAIVILVVVVVFLANLL